VVLIVNTLIGWFHLLILVFVVGVVLSRWIFFTGQDKGINLPSSFIDDFLLKTAIKGGSLLILAMVLLFSRQLVAFRDPFVPWMEDAWLLLRHTYWGLSWTATLIATSCSTAILYVMGNPGWRFATVLFLAGSMFLSFSGHANAVEGVSGLIIAADVLHVWAASGWLGSLVFLVVLDRAWRKQNETVGSLFPALRFKISTSSIVCVAILVISGVLTSSAHLSAVSDLAKTSYGQFLLLKIVLATVCIALGALNWLLVRKNFQHTENLEKLKDRISKEIRIGQMVLLTTAIVIQVSPPGHQTSDQVISWQMLLIRVIGVGMFFYVAFFVVILFFAAFLLKGSKLSSG